MSIGFLYTLGNGEIRIFRAGKRNDDEVYRNGLTPEILQAIINE
ncbi:MAG: hypothetical protein WCP16_15050 [Pseudanabaena sp. ELA645]